MPTELHPLVYDERSTDQRSHVDSPADSKKHASSRVLSNERNPLDNPGRSLRIPNRIFPARSSVTRPTTIPFGSIRVSANRAGLRPPPRFWPCPWREQLPDV